MLSADKSLFDEAYYQRYYFNKKTSVVDPEHVQRLGAFVCSYLQFIRVPVRRVLDVGCGIGLWRDVIKRHYPHGKGKSCPYCEQPIKLYLAWKIAGLLFIPAIVLALFLKPVFVSFGLSGSLATGLTTGALILLSMRLKVLPRTDA